jgi:hypothetical protein
MSSSNRSSVAALAISCCALLVAIGGTSVAVADAGGQQAVKKIVKKQVRKLAPSLSVARARDADALGGVPASSYVQRSGVRADGIATSADLPISSTTFAAILTKGFTAPTDGYVMVVATLSARLNNNLPGAHGVLDYGLVLDGTALTTDGGYHEIFTFADANTESGAVSAVVPVSAGAHTVALQAREFGAGTTVVGRDLSLVFTPSGSASVLPY